MLNELSKIRYDRIFFFMGLLLSVSFAFKFRNHFFWDMEIYTKAVNVHLAGGSSYLDLEGLRFVYSPLVLWFFSLFGGYLSYALVLGYFTSTSLMLLNPMGKYLMASTIISSVWFYNESLVGSIATGNLTIFMHFLIIALAIYKIKYQRFFFLLMISITSLIKPNFLAYIILGFILWPNDKTYYKHATAPVILVSICFASQIYFVPELFKDFIFSLKYQVFGIQKMSHVVNSGFAPYSILGLFFEKWYALIFHFVTVTFWALLYFHLFNGSKKILNAQDAQKLLFWGALIIIALLNPRILLYDYWLIQGSSVAIILIYLKYFNPVLKIYSISVILLTSLLIYITKKIHIYYGVFLSIYIPVFYVAMTAFILNKTNSKD